MNITATLTFAGLGQSSPGFLLRYDVHDLTGGWIDDQNIVAGELYELKIFQQADLLLHRDRHGIEGKRVWNRTPDANTWVARKGLLLLVGNTVVNNLLVRSGETNTLQIRD
jgi:hypothetical protein